jgi:predicted nucleotidyltransferase
LKAGLHHYLGQLRRGVEEDLTGEDVRLKRLFYALRSALAARWIRERHALPPMEFAPLRTLLPADLQGVVDEMLAQKAVSDEKTTVPRPAALVAFLAEEYAAGQAAREVLPIERKAGLNEALDELFKQIIQKAELPGS